MRNINLTILLCSIHLLISSIGTSIAKTQYKPQRLYNGQTIWELVKAKEENLDIGLWALIIAKEFDPSVEVQKNFERLDDMVAEINLMLAGRTNDIGKFLATRMYIYEAGIWNTDNPFLYDLDDPLGERLENQLLSTYLNTRLGNCVSMPTLFLALMERVDPNVPFAGVSAPLHLFCRLRNRQTGDIWNVEATNGGSPARNQWYIEQANIPQTAIDSGLYLKALSKREFLAELINILIRKERKRGNYQKALNYTELVLQLYPNSATALVHKGALLAWLGYKILQKAKKEHRPVTKNESDKLSEYSKESERFIGQAQALGWQPETSEQQEKYLQMVKQVK